MSNPEEGGQTSISISTTLSARESVMPETKTQGLGSTNQSFIFPRTASGSEFATTTTMDVLFDVQEVKDILWCLCKQIHFQHTFPEAFKSKISVIDASHFFG